MNHIDVENIKTRYGYTDNYWIFDRQEYEKMVCKFEEMQYLHSIERK